MKCRYLTLDDLASDSATAQFMTVARAVARELRALAGRGTPPAAPGRGVVSLTAAQVFHRRLTLPRAVLPTLGPLLAADFDRLTPFTRAQAYGDAQVTLSEIGPMTVDLWAVPRAVLDPLLAEAARRGHPVQAVLVPGAMRALRFGRHVPTGARVVPLLLGIVAALALAASGWLWPLWQREQAVTRLREEVGGLRQLLSATHAQAAAAHSAEAWARARPALLLLLADLTEAVPETSHVTSLTLRGDRIELAGITADPAALLTALGDPSRFSGVQFSAPLVSEAGGTRFALRLTRPLPETQP